MSKEKVLYNACKSGSQAAMKELFESYLPLLTAVCRRYAANDSDAKDLLQEGFIKIFSSIDRFEWKGDGSFTAWMKRIMVNNAINYCTRNRKYTIASIDEQEVDLCDDEELDNEINTLTSKSIADLGFKEEELIKILQQVPEPFRTVFNLYVIEGKKHKEIGDILGIPEKTSTTRLTRARKLVKQALIAAYEHHLVDQ